MKTGGIDACEAGYLAISLDNDSAGYWLLETQSALYDFLEDIDRIFIDIPIGLQDDKEVRECDELLRKKLGPGYKDSVISPPIRGALYAPTYGEASMISYETMEKRVTMQSWNMIENIRTIDNFLQNHEAYRDRIFESHPELLFQILNGGPSILQKKATKKGLRHRLHLLKKQSKYADDFFRDIKEKYRRNQVDEDNIVDTLALALFALKSIDEPLQTLPEEPPTDAAGLPMAIHYVRI